jgi:outer membrane protein TolC
MVGALMLALALAGAPQDTLRSTLAVPPPATLDLATFTRIVRARHPVARQARLARRVAGAELQMARGVFWDPVANVMWDRKTFGNIAYYDYVVAGVKVMTPLGIDLKLGYERTSPDGVFFNPDRFTPASGLLVAGVTVPLARGILTDPRRTAVTVRSELRNAAEADRLAIVNKLLFAAVKDYSAWYEAERRRAVADTGIVLAEFRLEAVRQRVGAGDAAAIDTVEARLELERRRVQELEAGAAANTARLAVSQYLWDDDGAPLELAADARPDLGPLEGSRLDAATVDVLLACVLRQHPDILKAIAKLRQAEAERRLARSELLPDASLEAAALGDDATTGLSGGWPSVGNNYKLGLSAKTSLLLIKERGKFDATRFKTEIAQLELSIISREVRLAVLAALYDVGAFESILARQRAAAFLSRELRDAEVRRFEAGESTLFLVNIRDRALLDETLKVVAFEAKLAAARAALAFALGEPGDEPER